MIVRYEHWGAWVKLESPPSLVALDRDGVRALGLHGGASWDRPAPSAPLEVHLAVTARCGAGCRGCYLDAQADGREPPLEELTRTLDALRDAGVFTVAMGGGEPTTRDDLDELARAARARGMTPVLTTSGLGLSDARIAKLRGFAQVNVSYDGEGAAYASVRGFDGAAAAERAVESLAAAGIRVGVNVVLTRGTFDRLASTLQRARELGANEAQLLRYKPSGRAASLDYYGHRLTPEQARSLGPTLRALVSRFGDGPPFPIRIDCALVPFLSADAELSSDPARLVQFGIFGCEAAAALSSVSVDGRVAPCSFAGATELRAEDLKTGHPHDPELARWRAYAENPEEPCATCPLRRVCKGGCKVVASFVSRAHGPDPECPRVVAFRAQASTV